MAYKAVVTAQSREKIRALLRRVDQEKGGLYLAMLAQSSAELPDRWSLVVSAPWIDSVGSRSAVAYLSASLKRALDKNALSAIDRISAIRSDNPLVMRILHFLGMRVSLEEKEIHIQNWSIEVAIPEAFIFVANSEPNEMTARHNTASTRMMTR